MQQLYANELRTTGKNFIPIGIKLDLKFDLTFEHLEKKTEIIKKNQVLFTVTKSN